LSLLLHFPWSAPVVVKSQVARVQVDPSGMPFLGVAFEDSEAARGRITAAIERALDSDPGLAAAAVLVFSDRPSLIDVLALNLSLLGQRSVLAKTPLDAVRWLLQDDVAIEAAVLDMELAGDMAIAMLSFLAEEFPWIRRVAVSRSGANDPWLQRLVSEPSVSLSLGGLLVSPWDPLAVRQAMRSAGQAAAALG
jgi:hypothetical protein